MTQAFSVFIQDLADGRVHAELSNKTDELIARVRATGKGGELTLKIKIKPATRAEYVEKVIISDSISLKLPEHERGDDFFYVTDDNDLSRKHPKQQELELRTVTTAQPVTLKQAKQ